MAPPKKAQAPAEGVTRVDLPGGKWWDIRTSGITYGEIKAIRTEMAAAQRKGADVDIDETLLLHFTAATSEVPDGDGHAIAKIMDGLGDMDASVTVLVMDVVQDSLYPLFPGAAKTAKSVLEAFTNR